MTSTSASEVSHDRTDDRDLLFRYVLAHADDNLILAQRLSGWISRAPDLEEDIALANIALDILGRARMLLDYAGRLEGRNRTEDDLAMFRSEREFTNLLLVEQPNGDFAHTMVRQFFFDAYQRALWDRLCDSEDATLSGIAGKAIKETRYHLRHSGAWLIRLGRGTEESHRRTQGAVDGLWRFTAEMFEALDADRHLAAAGLGVDPSSLETGWERCVQETLAEAGLQIPDRGFARLGGRSGFHTEHLGLILAEMQWMQRSYPGLNW